MGIVTPTEDLLEQLVEITEQLRWRNDSGQERSRNLSRAVSNLEDAEDKIQRHLKEAK